MNVGKRLFQYALHYKKNFILGLLMLTVAIGAELTGPFIAKTMIDDHILGIERPWHQVDSKEIECGMVSVDSELQQHARTMPPKDRLLCLAMH